jgi:hypothetical protein
VLTIALAFGCAGGERTEGNAPWNVPVGEQDGDIDVDPHDSDGSTTADEPGGGSMSPPPKTTTSGESGDAPMPEETTTTGGVSDEGSSGESGEGPTRPPGDPLWAPCNEEADCDSQVCFFLKDGETQEVLSAYCSESCVIPASDCPLPPTGNATAACLETTQGASLCALDCSFGQSCPFGMECFPITTVASYCF